jgi:hypothetical protein
MGLSDVFTAVEAHLAGTLGALGVPAPRHLVGEDKIAFEGAPPRIVWVPLAETLRGPKSQGGDGVRSPRPLHTRHARVAVHIWCADPTGMPPNDLAATETVLNHLVAAIHDVCHGAYDTISGDWSVGQASPTRLGMIYVLVIELQIPLTRELDGYATVTALPLTPQITAQG